MKKIKQGLLDMMNISYSKYNDLEPKPKNYQEISIDDMLYKPSSEFIKTDILELTFMCVYVKWKKLKIHLVENHLN